MKTLAVFFGVFIRALTRRHVRLQAQNRLGAIRITSIIELQQPRHRAVIRHRHRFHALILHELHQLWHFRQTIQQGIMGMIVQMHKITGLQLYCHVLIVAQKMATGKTAKFISNITHKKPAPTLRAECWFMRLPQITSLQPFWLLFPPCARFWRLCQRLHAWFCPLRAPPFS